MPRIPVIDLFAGPGGLGEGFSAFRPNCSKKIDDGTDQVTHRPDSTEGKQSQFKIRLSIEMDSVAHRTLELRAFFRQFEEAVPEDYYAYLRGEITREELFEAYPIEATYALEEAWKATLGEEPHENVVKRIKEALPENTSEPNFPWVLIGGPPCQAYSLVGRSRRKNDAAFATDHKHFLYLEYLRIIADHRPPVFVMENVQGILSSQFEGKKIFERIVSDLQFPPRALSSDEQLSDSDELSYQLYSLGGIAEEEERNIETSSTVQEQPSLFSSFIEGEKKTSLDVNALLVRCERYGIPQARPRVFIVGIRSDIKHSPRRLHRRLEEPPTLWQAIADLPQLRSRFSKGDSAEDWRDYISSLCDEPWIEDDQISTDVRDALRTRASQLKKTPLSALPPMGRNWMAQSANPKFEREWFHDPKLKGTANHEARGHMKTDLWRYFFAATFAEVTGRSPTLRDFPPQLYPAHKNVTSALKGSNDFSDRFRVQSKGRPSTTIVSHISKDGHYYIHPDPLQCRSLTVREAARLQTFRDNYFFEGPRTDQYHQVGNAVPPLLARQIAEIVYELLTEWSTTFRESETL